MELNALGPDSFFTVVVDICEGILYYFCEDILAKSD